MTVAASIIVGVGFSVYKYNGAPRNDSANDTFAAVLGASTTEADLSVSRFTSSGKIEQVAISPDGKFIAYVTADGPEKKALRLRSRDATKDVELVPAPKTGAYADISFSPDSNSIYYQHWFPPYTENTINRIPVTGGTPTKVNVNVESGEYVARHGKIPSS